jgi:hypothetical protein
MPSHKANLEAISLLGAVWVFCLVSFGVTLLYLKRVGARFRRGKRVESGVFTESANSATGISRRWTYGKRIGISYTTDFSHLTPDQRRHCENAIMLWMIIMVTSTSGTVIYLWLR